MNAKPNRLIVGWFLVLAGAVAALLIVWLDHVARVPLTALLTAPAVQRPHRGMSGWRRRSARRWRGSAR